MGGELDLWFKEDIARLLASTGETMGAAIAATTIAGNDPELTTAYQQGFYDALHAMARLFGIVPREQHGQRRIK